MKVNRIIVVVLVMLLMNLEKSVEHDFVGNLGDKDKESLADNGLSPYQRTVDLIISRSLAQNYGFTEVPITRRIAGYATILLALLWNHKASQNLKVIKSSVLSV